MQLQMFALSSSNIPQLLWKYPCQLMLVEFSFEVQCERFYCECSQVNLLNRCRKRAGADSSNAFSVKSNTIFSRKGEFEA